MDNSRLRVAVIGAGRMGRIRALSAKAHPLCEVVHVCDVAVELAKNLGNEIGCPISADWRGVIQRSDIDAVVVATPHRFLTEITTEAIKAHKHVFCEKPLARTAMEAEGILSALEDSSNVNGSSKTKPVVMVGYTLRHHPAVAEARRLVTCGLIGEPLYVRGRYGHGGRVGYQKEWRGNRELSGGGELVDQGVHLIDLSRCFLGEFSTASGFVDSYFWHTKITGNSQLVFAGPDLLLDRGSQQEVEDNAFMVLRTEQNKTAMLHASWTQWKNIFSFEVFGTAGSLVMEGLGGSYGRERLLIAKRKAEGGIPEMQEVIFDQPSSAGSAVGSRSSGRKYNFSSDAPQRIELVESCWDEEWDDFVIAVKGQASNGGNANAFYSASVDDGVRTLQVVDAVYKSAKQQTLADVTSLTRNVAAY